jgi:2-polyprenyl-3-methyl-5-hydroxy-6-metoxy-1,4-benzoquinol methylase
MELTEAKEIWEEALCLDSQKEPVPSILEELALYFPQRTRQEIREDFEQGRKNFAALWHELKVDSRSETSLSQFYNASDLEIFELLDYHSKKWNDGPLNYVAALEIAKLSPGRDYLDYGSGIGTGALLFERHGFKVTLCDISTPLLAFAQWRFKQRKRHAAFVDLKQEEPQSQYDLITCFEVLEHVKDPLGLLRKLHRRLKPNGILVVSAPFWEEEEHPMHIVHDIHLTKKFRGQGFDMEWNLKNQVRKIIREPFFILRKVERPWLANKFFEIYDYYIPDGMKFSPRPKS